MSWVYQYQSTNPCNCASSSSNPSEACTEETCNCLQLCNITISPTAINAPEPCGGELIHDVTTADHDTCACGANEQKWYVAYFDPTVFETATITLDGTSLNATTVSEFNDATSSNIILQFICGSLSMFITVVVGIKDMCTTPCSVDETCQPCTGVCIPNVNIGTE